MGHYASDMDPNWGNPPKYEQMLEQIDDSQVRALARVMFRGFDSMAHLDSTNAQHGINAAVAIDKLIEKRLGSHSKQRLDQLLMRARQNRD
jgi:hypothetical protein